MPVLTATNAWRLLALTATGFAAYAALSAASDSPARADEQPTTVADVVPGTIVDDLTPPAVVPDATDVTEPVLADEPAPTEAPSQPVGPLDEVADETGQVGDVVEDGAALIPTPPSDPQLPVTAPVTAPTVDQSPQPDAVTTPAVPVVVPTPVPAVPLPALSPPAAGPALAALSEVDRLGPLDVPAAERMPLCRELPDITLAAVVHHAARVLPAPALRYQPASPQPSPCSPGDWAHDHVDLITAPAAGSITVDSDALNGPQWPTHQPYVTVRCGDSRALGTTLGPASPPG